MRRGNYTKPLSSRSAASATTTETIPVSVQAQLAIAELHFKKKDFDQARFAYEEFASLHPRHKNLDLVVFRTGLSIYKRASRFAGRDQAATRQAVNTWMGYDARFPESDHIPEVDGYLQKARDRLAAKELFVARFYARKGSWGAVRNRAEYLLKRYPNSSSVPEGLELHGTALHRWGYAEEATRVRERLAELAPASRELARLDEVIAQPAGSPPDEKVFVRPYRIRGAVPPPQGGGGS